MRSYIDREAKTRTAALQELDWDFPPSAGSLGQVHHSRPVGDDSRIASIREGLWEIGFHPEVFKKAKQQEKAKGVDIALAKDFLGNAFRHNYDVAFLFAGDGDYVQLVEEAKRLGKIVCVVFFSAHGLSPSLKMAADHFLPIDESFRLAWSGKETPWG